MMAIGTGGAVGLAVGMLIIGGSVGSGATFAALQPRFAAAEVTEQSLNACHFAAADVSDTAATIPNEMESASDAISDFFNSYSVQSGDAGALGTAMGTAINNVQGSVDSITDAADRCGFALAG